MNNICNKELGATGRRCTRSNNHAGGCEGPLLQSSPAEAKLTSTVFYHTKHTCPSLLKAADDEPIFVIRAQDCSSAAVIQAWLAMNPQISEAKRKDAIVAMQAMMRWHNKKQAD